MESLRQDTVIHEVDPAAEIDFACSPANADSKPDQSIPSIIVALQLIWEQCRWLSGVAALALVISTVVAFLIPKQYESSVSIMPLGSLSSSESMLAALASPGQAATAGSWVGIWGSGALFVDLFRSRTIQDRVVDKLNLQNVYLSRYKQDARKRLNSRTEAYQDRKSGVISLTVTDENPQRAHDIAQAYVEELNRLVSEVSTSSARRKRIFVEQRLTTVKGNLEDAEKQFGAFASKHTTPDISQQTKTMVESEGQLQGQLIASESELQSLEQIYTSSNVRVRSLQARVDELKRQLQKMQGTNGAVISDATQSGLVYPSIRDLPLLGVEWADLYRRLKIQETVYELLSQQCELARIEEAKEIPTVNVVDPANVPEKKSFPPRLMIILSLTLLTVVGAALWIVGSERWQRVDPQDPGKMFAEKVWHGASGPVHMWFASARARFSLSRSLRQDAREPSE